MSDHESLERLVSDVLADHAERLYRRLDATDTHDRIDAGRALRMAARHDPRLVEPHSDALIALLSDSHDSLRLSGAVGLAELAEVTPTSVVRAVPELTALLADDAPAVRMAAIRGLARIGKRFPGSVSVADEPAAALSSAASSRIRTAVLSVFAAAVLADPARFPETVGAYERALDDDDPRVRRCAASAVASVARVDPTALESPERTLERIERIEQRTDAQPWNHDGKTTQAARTLRSVVEDDT